MGIATSLSPALVEALTREEEIPERGLLFSPAEINAILGYGAPVGSIIRRYDQLERGMDFARVLIREYEQSNNSFPNGLVITANELAGGRGRFQRHWHAPRGGLWMTVVLVNTLLPLSSSLYTLASGVAACETLVDYVPDARLKWVNDVHVNGRKLCGILSETMVGPNSGEEYILLGLGININNESFPEPLADTAVSLRQLLGADTDISRLAARLLTRLSWNIGLLHYEEEMILAEEGPKALQNADAFAEIATARPHRLVSRWEELNDTVGRRVMFGFNVQDQPQFEALVRDIGPDGSIVLELDDGSVVSQNSGEISYL